MQIEDCFTSSSARTFFKAGETLFKEGEVGDLMYVLLQGTVDVFVSDRLVGSFQAVEVIGEMALIDRAPRSATVVAKTDCEFVTLNEKRFFILTEHRPEFALHLMRVLVERVRWLNIEAQARTEKTISGDFDSTSVVEEDLVASGN